MDSHYCAVNPFLILIMIGGAAYAYNGYLFSKSAKFSVGKIKFDLKKSALSGFLKLHFNIEGKLSNPTGFVITVTSIIAYLIYDGKSVGAINHQDNIKISAGQSINVNTDVEIDTLNLFTSIEAAIAAFKSSKEISIAIKGKVETTAGTITINETKTLAKA